MRRVLLDWRTRLKIPSLVLKSLGLGLTTRVMQSTPKGREHMPQKATDYGDMRDGL